MDSEVVSITTLHTYAATFRMPNGIEYRSKISWQAEDSVSAIDMASGWADFVGETLVSVQRIDSYGRPLARLVSIGAHPAADENIPASANEHVAA